MPFSVTVKSGVPSNLLGITGLAPELFIYEFRGGKLHLIGTRPWEVGFELTMPQTVRDLHGED